MGTGRPDGRARRRYDARAQGAEDGRDLAYVFLGLPGGLGTLEEIIEVWSWRLIGFNDDPVGLLNINGFWTPLIETLERLVDAGFVRREVMDDLVVAETLSDALERFSQRMNVTFGDKRGRAQVNEAGAPDDRGCDRRRDDSSSVTAWQAAVDATCCTRSGKCR